MDMHFMRERERERERVHKSKKYEETKLMRKEKTGEPKK